jgi:hypothetical protein
MNNVMKSSYGDIMNDTSNTIIEDSSGMNQFLNKNYSQVLQKSYKKDKSR